MTKQIFIILITLLPVLSFADMDREVDWVVRAIDFHASMVAKFPQNDHSQSHRFVGSKILKFEAYLAHNENGAPTEASLKLTREINLDFDNDECQRDRQSTYCGALTRDLADYRSKYGTDYTPKPIAYPQFDAAKHTYTLPSGRTYDLDDRAYISGI